MLLAAALQSLVACTTPPRVVPRTPPAPRAEVRDYKPDPDTFWHEGHWVFNPSLDDFSWEPGHWERNRPSFIWVPGYWEHVETGYVWHDEKWEEKRR